jgi:hypothetical protein
VAVATGPGGATLNGTATQSAVLGVASFANLSLSASGSYTLSASSGGVASATSGGFQVVTPVLTYVDPAFGSKKLALVRNPASTDSIVVLDLVALVDLTGYSVGFNLPLDGSKVQASPALMTPGTALNPGTGVLAAAAALPSAGPLQGVLTSAQSQKAAGAGAVASDTLVPAGSVLYTLRLNTHPAAGGGVVFDGSSIASNPKFRAAFRDRQGNDVAGAADLAVGQLAVTLQ